MSFPKRVLYYGLLAALTLLAIEGMARLAYFVAFEEWYDGGLPGGDTAAQAEGERATTTVWPPIQHPFYGFVQGQANDLYFKPTMQQREDTVVIGLLGGSVARDALPYFRQAVYEHFAERGWPARPVVLELSRGALKQPQQVAIAAYTLLLGGHFDIIVNLDGFNEILVESEDFNRDFIRRFFFFPLFWDKVAELSAEEVSLAERIRVLRAEQAGRRAVAAGPLRYTAVWGMVRRYRWERREAEIARLSWELATTGSAYSLKKHGPRLGLREEDLSREAVLVWYRSSLLLAELAAVAGAEYYHFLQPNQYVPDAKPLSARELRKFYIPEHLNRANYRWAYPLLVEWGEKLRGQQVKYFDLTRIFQDRQETLYGDSCCHLNKRGNELLAAAMVERMTPALERAAAGKRPVSGLAAAAGPALPDAPELLIDAAFQVYRQDGNRLVYVKDGCTPADRQTPFFLHITPADRDNLTAAHRAYGFYNLDFRFAQAGVVLGGQCRAERRIPSFAIASIRTGQYVNGREVWAGEYRAGE